MGGDLEIKSVAPLTRGLEFLKVHLHDHHSWALIGKVAYIYQVDLQEGRVNVELGWEWEE